VRYSAKFRMLVVNLYHATSVHFCPFSHGTPS
jgi:hypothetical protein